MLDTGISMILCEDLFENLCKNKFDFTTAGNWDCVAAVEHLNALYYSVDFNFLSFGIVGSIWVL